MPHSIVRIAVALLVISLVAGCGRMRDRRSEAPVPNEQVAVDASASATVHEQEVLELAQRYIGGATGEQGKLIRRNPYFLKEYAEYTSEPGLADVRLQERQSRTVPLAADVRVQKIRFATDVHRNRDQARDDNNYFRSTGTETISFELRSGRWKRVGTLFVADETQELVDGVWTDRREPVVIEEYEPEDERGWFRRFWSGLTGRY
jgi:hypothetical protein